MFAARAGVLGGLLMGLAACALTPAGGVASAEPAGVVDAEIGEAVGALLAQRDVQAAFASIVEMDARNIERMISLNEIPAPPFAEEARAADLVRRFQALGLDGVYTDEIGNVIARRKGTGDGPSVAVVAHIDTVFPAETDVTVRREGDVFYAPGIGDNTRGLVVLLALAEVMQTHGLETKGDVLFIGSVGEEGLGDLRGVRHLAREGGPQIDSFIAIDGGRADRLIVTGVGSNRYRVTFSGPGGHSYGAFGRAHPHQALAGAIQGFVARAEPITKSGPKATFSVGRIGGGTSINSIPFTSWMEVDMRSANPQKLAELDGAFQEAMQAALDEENGRRRQDEALTVSIEPVGRRPAGATDPSTSLVQNAAAAVRALGLEPDLGASSTDANISMSLGIPAITMSRGGRSQNAHAPNESWENKDAHIAIQIALLTILAEAGEP